MPEYPTTCSGNEWHPSVCRLVSSRHAFKGVIERSCLLDAQESCRLPCGCNAPLLEVEIDHMRQLSFTFLIFRVSRLTQKPEFLKWFLKEFLKLLRLLLNK